MIKIKADLVALLGERYGISLPDDMASGFADAIHNEVLSRYFSVDGEWQPETSKYGPSGWAIVDRIKELGLKRVLDVGCGYNRYRGVIPNLVGIDPFNENADELVGLCDYETPVRYDAIICFGSVNFGTEGKIRKELAKVTALAADRAHVFFRVNPGLSHDRPGSRWIDFFGWSQDYIQSFASEFGWQVDTIETDDNRLYFEWSRS